MNKTKKPDLPIEKIVCRLAELGLDEGEISFSLGLKKKEFGELTSRKEFKTALEKGLENCVRRVEQALYRRATGFEYEEVVNTSSDSPASSKSSNGNSAGKTKSGLRCTVKTVIPDVNACIFWLKNRLPDKWRDPKDIESDGKKSIQDLVEAYEAKGFEEDD